MFSKQKLKFTKLSKKNTLIILIIMTPLLLFFKTYHDLRPVDKLFENVIKSQEHVRYLDRHGIPLMVSYQSSWNNHDRVPLHHFSDFVIKALILSEDRNFYHHKGIDWQAKAMALWQNIKARRIVRGASTLTEQVVHLLTNRPRTLWSKWLEFIESHLLERQYSKNHILEFYLNQVPFASNRRGLVQAARHYFNRDLSTLTLKETLSLLILIKAPSSYDLKKSITTVEKKMIPFAALMTKEKLLTENQHARFSLEPLQLKKPQLSIQATHFVRHLKQTTQKQLPHNQNHTVQTTLDGSLQKQCQQLLDQRIKSLSHRRVHNGAALVVDHLKGEVLAWVVGGDGQESSSAPGSQINAVTALRQPGSALKPFVYALALEKGWSPITLILDEPLVGPVGSGLHRFRNYSLTHYGPVTVSEALANSLNVPAVKAIQYVGVEPCLSCFRQLGFSCLQRGAEIYDEGLALGNGEVSLLNLVQAYTTLTNHGRLKPLRFLKDQRDYQSMQTPQIFTDSTVSIIGDILSDPWARRWEFGLSSVLNMPVQTAVKTGTSTDYRDAWVVAYNHRYLVGIWMGNLDNTPMAEVTGATGPTLLLRSILSILNRYETGGRLSVSSDLVRRDVCVKRDDGSDCTWQTHLVFDKGTEQEAQDAAVVKPIYNYRFLKPTPGLRMAIDPRIPRERQQFEFQVNTIGDGDRVQWILDNSIVGESNSPRFRWTLTPGHHYLTVAIYRGKTEIARLPPVGFIVK